MFKIVSSLMRKIKSLVEVCRAYRDRETDESVIQKWFDDSKAENERLRREEEEQEKLRLELLEVKRQQALLEREWRRFQEKDGDMLWEKSHCTDCGKLHRDCCCHLHDQEEVCETTLIQRQCAEVDDEGGWPDPDPAWCYTCNKDTAFCECTCCARCGEYHEHCQCKK